MAFDAGDRQEAVGVGARPPLQQRPRRRPAGHADHRGRRALRVRRERRPERDGRGDRQGPVARERAQAVRRVEHHVGAQRVAARPERSHPRQRRRAGRVDRRAEEDGRIADLEEPARRGRLFFGRAAARSAASIRRCTSPASARSASTSTTGKLLWSYDKVANNTANIATPIVRGNRVFLSSGYGTGAALLEMTPPAGGVAAHARSISRARCATITPARCWSAITCTASPTRILTAMQFDTGKVAWRDRSVGKGSMVVRRRAALSLQRERRRRPGGGQPHRLPRARPVRDRRRQPADVEPPGRVRWQAVHPRPGHDLRV